MAETESTFRQSLEFFNDLGVYDVILPFLLVFTLVFAMLEKTKVLGTEKVGEEQISKKSLNAIVAFVMAFFVVASVQLVNIVHQVLAQSVLLIIGGVLLLLFVNIFRPTGAGEKQDENGVLRYGFVIVAALSIIGVFLNNVEATDGTTWLAVVLGYASGFGSGEGNSVGASVVLFLVTIGILALILKSAGGNNTKKESK